MKLFTLLTAAASLLIVSACASTNVPTDERVKIETVSVSDAQPGLIYISPDVDDVFTLSKIESEINESGFLAVRVSGRTSDLSVLTWAFCGDIEYKFGYQFIWFDADGNRVSAPEPVRLRSTIPGDPVRFVAHAPVEECRNFALILCDADDVNEADGAESGGEEASEPADTRSEAAKAEEERVRESIPSLPQENVSGDKQEVKTIGVSDDAPAAVPAEKQ